MSDHGSHQKADERWSTIWPNLLQFVGPKTIRDEIQHHAEAAIASFLAESHYQGMFHFNQTISRLENFPQEASTPAASNNNNSNSSTAPSLTKPASSNNDDDDQKNNSSTTPTELGHRAALDFLLSSREYQQTYKKTTLGDALLNEARVDNDSWKKVSQESNGDGVWYRKEPGLSTHSFKVIGTLEKTPMIDLACVLLELDLFKEWFPMCFRSLQVGAIARYERCATFEVTCPWPMSNREACLWGFAIDDLERTRRCLIVAEEFKSKIAHVDVPAIPKNVVRLDVNQCGYILEAVDPTTTRVTFISNIDPKMSVPDWLLNWANSKFCGVLMWQMQRCARKAKEDPKSPYAERKKHDIYDDFKKRIAAMNYTKSVEQLDNHFREQYESAKPKKLTPLERQPKQENNNNNNNNLQQQQQQDHQGSKAAVAAHEQKK